MNIHSFKKTKKGPDDLAMQCYTADRSDRLNEGGMTTIIKMIMNLKNARRMNARIVSLKKRDACM